MPEQNQQDQYETQEQTEETGLPEGIQTAQEQQEETEASQGVQDATHYPFELDGQRFRTQEEAWEYAKSTLQQKDTELAQLEAYQRGLQESRQYAAAPQPHQEVHVEDDNFEERFYSNPKETLEEYRNRIKEELKNEFNQQLTQKEQTQQVWNDFTTAYPELAEFREDVDAIATKNAQLVQTLAQTRGQKAAFDYVAREVKKKFEAYMRAQLPQKEMNRTNVQSPPANSGQNVTKPQAKAEKVDMITQLRNMRRKRMG